LPEPALLELRELVRLRQQLLQQLGDRLRHLYRAVDLGFPEFTRYVRTLQSEFATTLLSHYPIAAALRRISVKKLARLVYDRSHQVGEELARSLIEAARQSVGAHAYVDIRRSSPVEYCAVNREAYASRPNRPSSQEAAGVKGRRRRRAKRACALTPEACETGGSG
jgi:hypothetical protein